jgi:hypothetical protein
MKTFILFLIIISGCSKQEPQVSDEVLFSITNECQATIKFYDVTDGQQSVSDIFDCGYVSKIALHIKPGTYRVKAETTSGRFSEIVFTKTKYFQELNVEF